MTAPLSLAGPRAALVALVTALGAACGTSPKVDPTPLPDHPCPDLALAPRESSVWRDAVASGDPVPLALALPIPPDTDVVVTQGNHGELSHSGDQAYAYDFGVGLGTAVYAAAPGVVVWMEDDHDRYGPDESFREDANYVVLDHGGGLFTAYVHLAQGGVDVVPGDVVAAGERLGTTGLSGQLTGPHLHFQVENVWSESLPARFVDVVHGGCALYPQEGQTVRTNTSASAWLIGRDELSDVPADAFAEDQVDDLQGFPARLFERGERPTISGHATLAGATEVVMLFLPPEGGTALAVRRFKVDADATFSGVLDLRDVAARAYGLAFVAGSGGPVSVPRSVLATVVE